MKKSAFIMTIFVSTVIAPFQGSSTTLFPGDHESVSAQESTPADTLKPKAGDWISLNMTYAATVKGKDTILYDNKVILKGSPLIIQLPPPEFKGDIFEKIMTLSRGDSGIFQINADSLFLRTFRAPQRPSFIDSNGLVTFHITLLSIDSPEEMQKREEANLNKYLTEKKITIKPRESGIFYLEMEAGTGLKIDSGCMVKINLRVYLIDGKLLYNSTDRPEPIKFRYGKRFDTQGLDEAIGLMRGGGKATIIVPSKMAFGDQGKGSLVPPFTPLVYEVEILDVQSKADFEKEQAETKAKEKLQKETAKKEEAYKIAKYLKDNNVNVAPTSTGLFYIEKVKGTGRQPVPGDKVSVHYTGTFLDGKKFDSSFDRNAPFAFTLGKGQVIKGWDEGIALMHQGGKATLIIPSNIAYGDRTMGEITPYSTLVFEVELLEVTPGGTK